MLDVYNRWLVIFFSWGWKYLLWSWINIVDLQEQYVCTRLQSQSSFWWHPNTGQTQIPDVGVGFWIGLVFADLVNSGRSTTSGAPVGDITGDGEASSLPAAEDHSGMNNGSNSWRHMMGISHKPLQNKQVLRRIRNIPLGFTVMYLLFASVEAPGLSPPPACSV